MNFPNRASANAYFRDYFTDDPQKITQYLNLYLSNFSSISDVSGVSTAGNAYYTDGKGTAVATDDTLALQSPVSGLYSSGLQTRYDGQGSPFYAYISAAKLSGLPSGVTLEFRNADNEIVAIINTSTHNFSYDSTVGSTVRLIVSKGDVEINSNYTGMILTEQTLTVNANITAVALSVEMLGASCTVSGTTYYLSDLLTGANNLSGASSTETDPWNLNVLVAYENWAKN